MSTASTQIDSVFDVVTPENIAFDYQMAGPLRRLPAYVADFVIRLVAFVAVVTVAGYFTALTGGLIEVALMWQAALLLLWFVLEWFYGGLFETFWNGQTPGKRLFGLRVLTIHGEPINGLQAVMRNVLRFADSMPLLPMAAIGTLLEVDIPGSPIPTFLAALIVPAMNRRWQRLGDLVCGTMVVVEERHWMHGVVRLTDPRVQQLAAELPHFAPSQSLAQALAMYVERRHLFSPPRRQEIAMHLGQVLTNRYQLLQVGDQDLLLCAIYWRLFVSDSAGEARPAWAEAVDAPLTQAPEIELGPLTERRR